MMKMLYLNLTLYFLLTLMMFFLLLNIANHPVMIMVLLLIYSSLICLNMSMWKSNYILSIFLFLMMISGLLIIFLYFSSLISNEQFKIKINYLLSLLIFYIINLIFTYFLINLKVLNLSIYSYKFQEIFFMMSLNKMNFYNIQNLYDYPLNNLTLLSMFYLLISLFSIIKICSFKFFSLRKIN